MLNKKIAAMVDKIADDLESKGLSKEALELDIVSNTLEAGELEVKRDKNIKTDPNKMPALYDGRAEFSNAFNEIVNVMGEGKDNFSPKDVDMESLNISGGPHPLAKREPGVTYPTKEEDIKRRKNQKRAVHEILNDLRVIALMAAPNSVSPKTVSPREDDLYERAEATSNHAGELTEIVVKAAKNFGFSTPFVDYIRKFFKRLSKKDWFRYYYDNQEPNKPFGSSGEFKKVLDKYK